MLDNLARHGYRRRDLNTFEDGLRLRENETGPNVFSAILEPVGYTAETSTIPDSPVQ